MRKATVLTTLTMAAAIVATFGVTASQAGFPVPPIPGVNMPLVPIPGVNMPLPGVNVQVNGYLPAPPGVRIQYVDDRPYYMGGSRHDRRVYLERDHRHKKYKKHKDHGYRDRGEGHGRNKHRDRD